MSGSADVVVRIRPRNAIAARPRRIPEDDKALSEQAVRAIEEGRADHAAGRTFTLAEIEKELKLAELEKELGIAPGGPGRDPE